MVKKKDDLTEKAGRLYWHEADARVIIEAWQQSGENLDKGLDSYT